MLNAIRAGLRSGRVTTTYPEQPEPAPPAYRGRPVINPSRCDCSAACADACPSNAISVLPLGSDTTGWELDLARCVFCGLCAEACPNDAIAISNDFELAARSRADLITRVTFGPAAVPSRAAEPALPGGGQNADHLGERIRTLLKRSLHIRHMDAGSDNSTDWELSALLGPVYDLQRLGIDVVASPRHADLLFVTGAVTRHLEAALHRTYEAMPAPRLVVAAGSEACGGGVLQGSYAVAGGVDRCLPVDVYIPGDPPRPQALIHGLLLALDRIEPRIQRTEMVVQRPDPRSERPIP